MYFSSFNVTYVLTAAVPLAHDYNNYHITINQNFQILVLMDSISEGFYVSLLWNTQIIWLAVSKASAEIKGELIS